MESKYYTPTIEEWHVDFEYEQRREIWDRSYPGIKVLEYIWEPVIGNLGQFKEGIDPDRKEKHYRFTNGQLGFGAYSNMVRVKYLDKEDIESFGFKCEEENKDGSYYKFVKPSYNGSNIILCHYIWHTGNSDLSEIEEHRKIKIYRTGGTPITFRVNAVDTELPIDRDMLSLSEVKNKSELKVLLKQLGIE